MSDHRWVRLKNTKDWFPALVMGKILFLIGSERSWDRKDFAMGPWIQEPK